MLALNRMAHSTSPTSCHLTRVLREDPLKATCSDSISKQTKYPQIKIQAVAVESNAPKKPMRPLTAYHIFFQIEREYIIQTMDGDDADKTLHDKKVYLDKVPDRYKAIKLMPDWYAGPGKREKRKHRKSHGKIGFLELSRVISSRWAQLEKLDPQTKKFVQKIAEKELQEYQREMKQYKEWTKGVASPPAKVQSPPSRAASSSPAVSTVSQCTDIPHCQPVQQQSTKDDQSLPDPRRTMPMNDQCQLGPHREMAMSLDNFCLFESHELENEVNNFISCIVSNNSDTQIAFSSDTFDVNHNGKRKMEQPAEEAPLLPCLDPVMDYSCAVDNFFHPNKKRRSTSPSSVVDICDDEIFQLWSSQNH